MDVDTAFLYVPIDEPNWVKVPDDTNLLPGDSGIYTLLLLLIFSCIERSDSMLVQYDQSIFDLNNSWKILKITPCLYVEVLQQLKKILELELRLWLWQFYVVDLIISVPTKYTDWINFKKKFQFEESVSSLGTIYFHHDGEILQLRVE